MWLPAQVPAVKLLKMSDGLLIATLVLCLVILGSLLVVGLILGITWACGGSCVRPTAHDVELGRPSP